MHLVTILNSNVLLSGLDGLWQIVARIDRLDQLTAVKLLLVLQQERVVLEYLVFDLR